MNDLLASVPTILNYGFVGFAFLLAFLAYKLLRAEGQKKDPNRDMLKAIKWYSLVCLLLSAPGAVIEATKGSVPAGFGSRLGSSAEVSFTAGGDARKLAGCWKATWFMVDEAGKSRRYGSADPESGKWVEYPVETIQVRADRSVVSASARFWDKEDIDYWYEGRLTKDGDVTLVYWMQTDHKSENVCGIVFLELETKFGETPQLKGNWQGRTRSGKITKGTTEWRKVE